MPIPLSRTAEPPHRAVALGADADLGRTRPGTVNFTALPMRFWKTLAELARGRTRTTGRSRDRDVARRLPRSGRRAPRARGVDHVARRAPPRARARRGRRASTRAGRGSASRASCGRGADAVDERHAAVELGAWRRSSSSAYIEIVVSGACRSCEVTDANWSSSAFERSSSALECSSSSRLRCERVGHGVEAAREVAELVVAAGRHARGQVAVGEAAGRRRRP